MTCAPSLGAASGEAPAPPAAACGATDRREGDRYRTVWRIAKVAREGDAGLWRVRNMSNGGMMLAADVPVTVGERLEVELSDRIVLRGRVAWAKEGRCGVAFDTDIDVAEVLRQLAADQRVGGYRQPRLPVRMAARAVVEYRTIDIELVDLSQSGVGFVHDGGIEVGKEIELVLASGVRRKAIVRWSRGTRAGAWLTQPLGRADLESVRRFEG